MAELPVDAHSIPRRTFSVARRGFEQHEVRAYLQQIAEVVARLQRVELELRERAERAESRAELAERLDEHRLVEIVGEETARVLEAARSAAAEIKGKAEEASARLLSEGHDEIARLRSDADAEITRIRDEAVATAAATQARADSVLEERTAEAEREVERIRAEAAAAAEAFRAEAVREAEREAAEAIADVEATRAEGKRMVAEAQVVRERVLRDLARRRRAARVQVERLNAGRERLLSALETVRNAADDSVRELSTALPEARAAGEMAARRVEDELEETLDALEAEIAAARVDLPLVEADDEQVEPHGDDDSGEHDLLDAVPPARLEALPSEPARDDEPEPVAAPEAQTVEAETVERRSSTVRLFRRRSEAVEAKAGDADLVLVEAPDEVEQVHVLSQPEPAPQPQPQPQPAPQPQPPTASDEPATDPPQIRSEPVASSPEEEAKPSAEDVFARLRATREEPAAADTDADTAEPEAAADVAEPEPDAEVDAASDGEPQPEPNGERALLARRDEALAPLERDLAKRMKRVLADEQNEVLDRVRRIKPKVIDDVVLSTDDHLRVYVDAGSAVLRAAAVAGAAELGGEHSGDVTEVADTMAQSLVNPLRDRVARSMEAADGDQDELSDRLRALYREWKGQRIGEATRHATAAAFARGLYEAAPDGCALRWVVDAGGESCPDADDNALAGAITKGAAFPTGDVLPPAHPGCRCIVVPEHR